MKFVFTIILLLTPFQILASESLIITEVKVRGESPDNSFIKIYNPEKIAIDISGFKIRKKSSTGKEYSIRVLPKESVIPPENYFIWANSRNDYHLEIKADAYSSASISSNNSVALFSPDGIIIDCLAWGGGENQFYMGSPFLLNPQENDILKRFKNGSYQNTKNNAGDFYLFSENKPHFEDSARIEKAVLEKEKNFPLMKGLSLAIISAFVALFLKKTISKNNFQFYS